MSSPSRSQFLEQVEQIISKRFPLVKLERKENDFSLRINGHWTNLENLYRSMAIEGDESGYGQRLAQHVDRWVVELLRAAEGSPDQTASFEELRPRIYPILVSKGRRDVAGQAMLTQPLLADLLIAYGVDNERTISYIPRKAFDGWGITLDDLHEAALENLMSRSEVLQAHAAADDEGKVNLIIIQTMDGYDASRLLLPGLHDHLRGHLASPFVAGVPNRDILVCFRDEPKNVARVRRQITQDFSTMPHQVTDKLFLVTPDGIAPYDPEESDITPEA